MQTCCFTQKLKHMYTGFLHAHSGLRYITIILILALIIQSFLGWKRQRKYHNAHQFLASTTVVILHLQLVLGIALYLISSKVMFDAVMMKNTLLRFFTLEHPLMMLLAIIVITVGHFKSRAFSNYKSHKRQFWSNTIGLILILASIPWPFRTELGAGWF